MGTVEQFADTSTSPFVVSLTAGWRFTPGSTLKYYLQPSDIDQNGTDDWVQEGRGAGIRAAFAAWEAVANIHFVETTDKAQADTVEQWVAPNVYLGGIANHSLPGTTGIGNYRIDIWGDRGQFTVGGLSWDVFLHELGHYIGLLHPHDGGPSFPGVTGPFTVGDNSLNSRAFTVMSYRDVRETFGTSGAADWGYTGGPMAFDIAAAQSIYGPNRETGKGATTYYLPIEGKAGTFWSCIWDAGGTDTIRNGGATACTIDLRAATLKNEPGGGGWFSSVEGIKGGFSIAAGVVIENAIGGGGDDVIVGNAAANRIAGSAGNDILTGGGGKDTIAGGAGTDVFSWWRIDDSTVARPDVVVDFKPGVDQLDLTRLGVKGAAVSITDGVTTLSLDTMLGTMAIAFKGTYTVDQLLGVRLNTIGGTSGADTLTGTKAADNVIAGGGDDAVVTGSGADVIVGGLGNDTLEGSGGNDTIWGGRGDGVYTRSADNDRLVGASGDDVLHGESGNDILLGGIGYDRLYGGAGKDRLVPGAEAGFVDGGEGIDTLVIDLRESALHSTYSYFGNEGSLRLSNGDEIKAVNVERLRAYGGSGNDYFFTPSDGGYVDGGAGNDIIYGWGIGDDILIGGSGDDEIYTASDDNAYGGDGNDTLFGTTWGDGADLHGGKGADLFSYYVTGASMLHDTADRIRDFSKAEGDRIDLSRIDPDGDTTADEALTFIGGAGFSAAGQVRVSQEGSYTFVDVEVTGDGVSDLAIRIDGLVTLVAADFVL